MVKQLLHNDLQVAQKKNVLRLAETLTGDAYTILYGCIL